MKNLILITLAIDRPIVPEPQQTSKTVVCELMEAKSLTESNNISEASVFIWKKDSGAILNLRPFTSSIIYSCPCNSSKGNEFPSPALKKILIKLQFYKYIMYYITCNMQTIKNNMSTQNKIDI